MFYDQNLNFIWTSHLHSAVTCNNTWYNECRQQHDKFHQPTRINQDALEYTHDVYHIDKCTVYTCVHKHFVDFRYSCSMTDCSGRPDSQKSLIEAWLKVEGLRRSPKQYRKRTVTCNNTWFNECQKEHRSWTTSHIWNI